MVYSMTGFGRSDTKVNDLEVQIELKSINGKNAEISARLPNQLKAFEIPFRKKIIDTLKRGSIELYILIKENGNSKPMTINNKLVVKYYESLKEVANELKVDENIFLSSILSLPEIASPTQDLWSDAEIAPIDQAVDQAIENLMDYRATEGDKIKNDLAQTISSIRSLSGGIDQYEEERKESIRNRLSKNMEELSKNVDFDKNRMEQELFYYIEKIDISEEKQRLKSHLDYFDEILDSKDGILKGKKLNFISQEIGRELNTLGAKSYNNEMQKLVIQMKDQLEKIKEQILNVL